MIFKVVGAESGDNESGSAKMSWMPVSEVKTSMLHGNQTVKTSMLTGTIGILLLR